MPELQQVEPIPRQVRFTLPIPDLARTIVGGLAKRVERAITNALPGEILRKRRIATQLQIINECCVHLTPFSRENLIGLIERIQTIWNEIWEGAGPGEDPQTVVRVRIAQAIDTDTEIHALFAGSASDLFDPRTLEVILTHGEFIQAIPGILTTEIEDAEQLRTRLILVSLHALHIFRRDDDAIRTLLPENVNLSVAYNTYIGTLNSFRIHHLINRIPPGVKTFAKHVTEYLEAKRGVLLAASREP